MTYARIKELALLQLDENPSDVDEYSDLLGVYINEGYQQALRDYYRPREIFILPTDENGVAVIEDLGIIRIAEATEHEHGYSAWATMDGTGTRLHTAVRDGQIRVLAVVEKPDLVAPGDEPVIPSWSHGALVDYACFRFLSNGNMAKQSRAQFYLQRYLTTMQRMMPQGSGSVTGYKNLYTVTDARWTR